MSDLPEISIIEPDLNAIAGADGRVVVFLGSDGAMDRLARRVNRLTRGALLRFAESEGFAKMKEGDGRILSFPAGLAASALQVIKLDRRTL